MNILSLCSKELNSCINELNDKSIKKIEYETLLDIFYFDINTLENLNCKYDCIYIDIISILKDHYVNKHNIISVNNDNKNRLIDEKEKKKIFIRSFNTIINRLIKNNNINEIKLIVATFDEQCEEVSKFNLFLNDIYNILVRENPGISTIDYIGTLRRNDNKYFIDLKKKNDIEKTTFKGEKIYPSIKNIRYFFEKAKIFNKNKLIVVFSAFSKDIAKYNYINTLKCIDCNKLFILDDHGIRGSYYIGLDGKYDIETSVFSLITKIMNENDINFKNVISAGSSKGGSAAIYYGLKYNFGNIIAGAPQYKIGTYLCDLTVKEYGVDIFGDNSLSNRLKYDSLIELIIENNQNTEINLLTGVGDPQYIRVLKEFEDVCKLYKLKLKETLIDIENHADISKKFPEYLIENTIKILKGKGCIKNKKILNIFKRIR